ncbi:glyoxal oxidase [Hysterangium stoloniferum]|nr:glyoxal oxidase [Hysterangium stoloniferum]
MLPTLLLIFLTPLLTTPVLANPGQPTVSGTPGQFQLVGNSLVSAQQVFLGAPNKMYIVDKVENNPTTIAGHPAWAAEYDLDSNMARAMDIVTNSFCAGGNVLGNGTWVNIGGNQAVTWGGNNAADSTGDPPYDDPDGGFSIRLLDPCDDETCNWVVPDSISMTSRRWYPTVETLEDGSCIIIGGNQFGGFINSAGNSNPTFEYFPPKGSDPNYGLPMLENTLPANLYPLTWLLPSGNLFLQINWAAAVFNYKANGFVGTEFPFPNIPAAVRTYPASGASTMLPLTPQNNWTATILFCGGTNLEPDQWGTGWNLAKYPTSDSCVNITPDKSTTWVTDDSLPQGRTLGNLVLLPDQTVFLVNGANTGVAGYGNDSWAIGHSYADNPVYQPTIYHPTAPAGSRFQSAGLSAATIPRLYHSVAILLLDGSVFISGSNPNPDYTVGDDVAYPTEYRVERFFPLYYNKRRPEPGGLPTQLTYGGAYFNVTLSSTDLSGDVSNLKNTKVVVIRQGFTTHAMSMGQRLVELDLSYAGNADGSGTLYVSQLPPNPAIIAPGPAFIFVVVNGIPSVGVQVMCGSGKIGKQTPLSVPTLPLASFATSVNGTSSGNSTVVNNDKNGAFSRHGTPTALVLVAILNAFLGWLF